MTNFDGITLLAPYLRVNNREINTAFYRDQLGFKLLKEENALVFFGGHEDKETHLITEESPSTTVREVEGPKKVNKLLIKVRDVDEIEALLARGTAFTKLYQGPNGYAFETLSPEGDCFLVHGEDDESRLVELSDTAIDFKGLDDFIGLSAFSLERLVLNVPDTAKEWEFYHLLDGLSFLPEFQAAQGQDLMVDPNKTWDLEILEYQVPKDYDLAALKVDLISKGQEVFLDRAERVLVLTAPNQIEIWFSK